MNLLNLLNPSRWIARCYHNWLNPLATLYFNFHYLPLKQAVKLPIWLYGRPKFLGLKGKVEIASSARCGMIRLNVSAHSPYGSLPFEFVNDGGTLRFAGKASWENGGRLHLCGEGLMELGDGVRILSSTLGCQHHLTIGAGSWVTNHSTVLDADYHLFRNRANDEVKCPFGEVTIGEEVTILAHCFVGKGCTIAPHSVLSSYTVMKRPIEAMKPYSLVAGNPAQVVREDFEHMHLTGADERVWVETFKAQKQ